MNGNQYMSWNHFNVTNNIYFLILWYQLHIHVIHSNNNCISDGQYV